MFIKYHNFKSDSDSDFYTVRSLVILMKYFSNPLKNQQSLTCFKHLEWKKKAELLILFAFSPLKRKNRRSRAINQNENTIWHNNLYGNSKIVSLNARTVHKWFSDPSRPHRTISVSCNLWGNRKRKNLS